MPTDDDEDIDRLAKTAGALLADVAESFISAMADFNDPPLYVRLREYAPWSGPGSKPTRWALIRWRFTMRNHIHLTITRSTDDCTRIGRGLLA
ncbi:hypothetical protein [Desulfovibrio sp. TomC]|uniref:hypothetical protein n=1 Tax=Desulfovibrio sp. TomC TaxID=1562888 RepID=UPI0005BA7031|nr:hypothetical protein [Desulfovibrio sp. TomC]